MCSPSCISRKGTANDAFAPLTRPARCPTPMVPSFARITSTSRCFTPLRNSSRGLRTPHSAFTPRHLNILRSAVRRKWWLAGKSLGALLLKMHLAMKKRENAVRGIPRPVFSASGVVGTAELGDTPTCAISSPTRNQCRILRPHLTRARSHFSLSSFEDLMFAL